jgi:predicted transcriptional regulator
MRTYNVQEIAKHVNKKFGRRVYTGTLKERARSLFKKRDNLTGREAIELIRTFNPRRLPLSAETQEEILGYLRKNRSLPPPERLSIQQIAKIIAKRKTPVSTKHIVALNKGLKESLAIDGKPAPKVMSTHTSRATVLPRLRQLLRDTHSVSRAQAAKSLGLSRDQLQTILAQYNTSFMREKKKARTVALSLASINSNGLATNAELASQFGLHRDYVRKLRKVTHQKSISSLQVKRTAVDILYWMRLLTGNKDQSIEATKIARVSGRNKLVVFGALAMLEKEGKLAAYKENGRKFYSITKKGIAASNQNGASPTSTTTRLEKMTLEELSSLKDRLVEIKFSGVPQSGELLARINQAIEAKIARKVNA